MTQQNTPELIEDEFKKRISEPLINYTLHLADNSLILGHRNSEWAGHGPILEQDIAISNIALDLIGQARNLYQYTAQIINDKQIAPSSIVSFVEADREINEDDLAYLREESEYKNCLLVEQPNVDWAQTILRQFFFSAFQYYYYKELLHSKDAQLSAIAEKSLKETTYHLRWSSEWVIRLGDGTDESKERIQKAIDELWMFTGELFESAEYEATMIENGVGVSLAPIKTQWLDKVQATFEEATLIIPTTKQNQSGGKKGIHTEYLGFVLAEMQYLQRAYPNSKW